ncbi:hypothetical protein [Treponema zioleckii]|uniref:hypothetical protein n=1 Tax=Treponema zioleckii TaxID=331680 RepID=UPI00168AF2C3|nr:hypothetical protein [Treponema zioleckii]
MRKLGIRNEECRIRNAKFENYHAEVASSNCHTGLVSASRFRNKFGMTRFSKLGMAMFAMILSLSMIFALVSCADENGLHDQNALLVTMKFTGFGSVSGNYSIPGNFDGTGSWDNTNVDVVLKDGEGTSNQIAVTVSNIQFSLCPVNSWDRPWNDNGINGNGSSDGKMQNFYIDGLDLGAGEVTLVIDASSGTAVPVVE